MVFRRETKASRRRLSDFVRSSILEELESIMEGGLTVIMEKAIGYSSYHTHYWLAAKHRDFDRWDNEHQA